MKALHNDDPSNAQGLSTPQKWQWSANVLLIGTSQSGKSTLINRFRTLAVGPHPLPDPAVVGQGTTSCTKDPSIYEYDVPMSGFVLTTGSSKMPVTVPSDEKGIFDGGFWKRKDLIVQHRNPAADLARIRLIDTPGLDDSDSGRNATNIEKVLKLLNNLSNSEDLDRRHISAVMFVMKESQPFHASLQEWYHHYKRCMPNLFGSIAVVNTNYRFRTWKTDYVENSSHVAGLLNIASKGLAQFGCRDLKMRTRREDWAKIFKSDPTHFFIDSKPAPSHTFEEYVSLNTVFDMLLYLRSQGRLPIENIRMAKLPYMSSIDTRVTGYLRDVCSTWEKEKDVLVSSLSTTQQGLTQNEENIVNWNAEIEEMERKIKDLDTDVQYDLNTYQPTAVITAPERVWKICTFSGHENTLSIKENVFPFEVSAPDTESTTWISKSKAKPDTKTWTGEYRSKWTKIPQFSNRSYTTNKIYYAAEISKAKNRIQKLEDDRDETAIVIARQKLVMSKAGSSMENNPRISQLTNDIVCINQQIKRLQEDNVPLRDGFSASAIQRYAKTIDVVDYEDALEFIAEVDPSLRASVEVGIQQIKGKAV